MHGLSRYSVGQWPCALDGYVSRIHNANFSLIGHRHDPRLPRTHVFLRVRTCTQPWQVVRGERVHTFAMPRCSSCIERASLWQSSVNPARIVVTRNEEEIQQGCSGSRPSGCTSIPRGNIYVGRKRTEKKSRRTKRYRTTGNGAERNPATGKKNGSPSTLTRLA